MENIKRWFENDYENYDFEEYEGHLEARTKTTLFMIVEPHSGTDNKWMLRVTFSSLSIHLTSPSNSSLENVFISFTKFFSNLIDDF